MLALCATLAQSARMPKTDSPVRSVSKNLFLDEKLCEITDEFVKNKKRESFSSLVEKLLIRYFRSNQVQVPEHLQ
jgi:hypothetical protein